MAEGIVKQIIQLIGLDQASGTVAKVKGEVADMHASNAEGFKTAAEKSGDLEKGLLGVRDLVGDLPAPVQKIADAFGGAEKILQIMPGPIGMIGAGLAVASASAYILFKNISETQAKMQLLGGERTFAFKEKLGLAVDDAVKLTQAVDKLPKALQPTDKQLEIVAKRAESLGLEGKDAVLAYVDALSEGPEKLVEFEQSFGRLGKAAISLPAIDKQLGLDVKAIEAANGTVAALDRAKTLRADAERQQIIANSLANEFNVAQEKYAKSSLAAREANADELKTLREQADTAKELADAKKLEYDRAREALELEQRRQKTAKDFANANERANAEIAKRESEVAFIVDKNRQSKAQQLVLGLKLADIERQRLAIQDQLQKKLIDEQAAKLQLLNLETQQNTIVAQNQAAQREKAKAAADQARSFRQAELQAVAKLSSAQAEALAANQADELEVYRARIEAINKQEQADIKAAQAEQATAKAKAAKIDTIRIEAEAKRKKLNEDALAVEAARENESIEGDKRVAAARLANIDTVRKARIAAATDPAAKIDLQIADLVVESERKIKEARDSGLLDSEARAARIAAIEAETTTNIKVLEKAKRDAIIETQKKAFEGTATYIAKTSDLLSGPATMIASAEQKSLASRVEALKQTEAAQIEYVKSSIANENERNNAIKRIQDQSIAKQQEMSDSHFSVGNAMLEAAKQAKNLSANWVENKDKAGSIIGAVGGVAAAFVDGEREKAGVLALMETAAAAVAIATGDIPGAIAHGTAAALYGSVAGGLIGGGASAAPAATGGGGFAATAAGGGGGAGGPAGATVINFNAPLGTAYEIGKSVVKAQKAAGASGWSPNMAMGV